MANLGTLTAAITARDELSVEVEKAVKRANKQLEQVGRGVAPRGMQGFLQRLQGMFSGVNLSAAFVGGGFNPLAIFSQLPAPIGAAVTAATAFFQVVSATTNEVSELVDRSHQLGVSFNALVGLQHAGSLSGVGAQEMVQSTQILNRHLGEIAQGGGREAAEALGRLGLNAEAVAAGGADQALLRIADGMQGVGSAAERAAIANQLFGRAGPRMLNLLSGGSGEIRRMMGDATALGLTLRQDVAEGVEGMGDQFERLQRLAQGAMRQIVAGLQPILGPLVANVVQIFTFFMQGLRVFGTVMRAAFSASPLAILLNIFSKLYQVVTPILVAIADGFDEVGKALEEVFDTGLVDELARTLQEVIVPAVVFLARLFTHMAHGIRQWAEIFRDLQNTLATGFLEPLRQALIWVSNALTDLASASRDPGGVFGAASRSAHQAAGSVERLINRLTTARGLMRGGEADNLEAMRAHFEQVMRQDQQLGDLWQRLQQQLSAPVQLAAAAQQGSAAAVSSIQRQQFTAEVRGGGTLQEQLVRAAQQQLAVEQEQRDLMYQQVQWLRQAVESGALVLPAGVS